jgi:uncharacterized protein (DUF2147 family)
MRKRHLVVVMYILTFGSALAAEPTGEWLVADGSARISIAPCDNALWGTVSWVRKPGYDRNNPDPAKRGRPIVGVPILRNMKPAGPNKWEGEVYNAKSGKMYSAKITLLGNDRLKIEGCVLGGIFCGGENWTRVQDSLQGNAQQTARNAPAIKSKDKKPERRTSGQKSGQGPAVPPAKDGAVPPEEVCYES